MFSCRFNSIKDKASLFSHRFNTINDNAGLFSHISMDVPISHSHQYV